MTRRLAAAAVQPQRGFQDGEERGGLTEERLSHQEARKLRPRALDRRNRRKRLCALYKTGSLAVVATQDRERESLVREDHVGVEDIKGFQEDKDERRRPNEEEEEFGSARLGFPTLRRPAQFRREIDTTANDHDIEVWFQQSGLEIGEMPDEERRSSLRLLYTWRDLFVRDVRDMPATDLIEHRIPIYEYAEPKAANPQLYTPEENTYMQLNIPKLIEAGIITQCESPWSARTKFPRKKNGRLRMVHVFCPINRATIKSNYPMKRIEPIIKAISQPHIKIHF